MPDIYMIRHGKASAGWALHPDPGLDDSGRKQARRVAERFAGMPPLPVLCSPLARTRETARFLCRRWQCEPEIEPRIAEIPSPGMDLQERHQWLRQAMAGKWQDMSQVHQRWRQELVECVLALRTDTLMFTHFIAINAVAAVVAGDDRVVMFRPDNCSVTHLCTEGDHRIRIVRLGDEDQTMVG